MEEVLLAAAGGPDELARLVYADWLEEQGRPGWESSWWRLPCVPVEGAELRRGSRGGQGRGYGYTDAVGVGDGVAYGTGYADADGGGDGLGYGNGIANGQGCGLGYGYGYGYGGAPGVGHGSGTVGVGFPLARLSEWMASAL